MRIKRLFIRDFGIFNNQLLDEVGTGLVVIGGHNRAGKTTLLQLLRHIAFGFPRKKKFISARSKHEIEAIISLENNDELSIHLQGFGEPVLNVLKGNREISSTKEIYNNLDPFTYQQLFTISLDELQANQGNSEKEKLQSILLGAGLHEFILLPQMEEFFNKEAEKIGGKNGDPKVKEFKPYFNEIEDGLKIRSEASSQVERYNMKLNELKKVEKNISSSKKKKNTLDREINRLDILKNNYDLYNKIIEIKSKISTVEAEKYLNEKLVFYPERARDIINRLKEKRLIIKEQTVILKEKFQLSSVENISDKIYKYQTRINILKERLSGLKEKINYYYDKESELNKDENELKSSLNKINEDWCSELKKLDYIKTDQIQLISLQENIDKYNKISLALEREKGDLLEYKERRQYLKESLDTLKVRDPQKRLRFYFTASFGFIILGTGLSFINKYLGITGLVGILGLTLLFFYKYSLEKGYLIYREKSFIELSNLEQKIKSSLKKTEEYNSLLQPMKKKLNRYRNLLGLSLEASPELIKEYFKEIQEIKSKSRKNIGEKKLLQEKLNDIEEELREIISILNEFPRLLSLENIDLNINLYLQNDIIFSQIKRLFDFTENILKIFAREKELEELSAEAKNLFSTSGLQHDSISKKPDSHLEDYLEHSEKKQYYLKLKENHEQLIQQLKAVLNTELVRTSMFEENNYKNNSNDSNLIYKKFVKYYNQFLSLASVEESYKEKRIELDNLIKNIETEQNNLISIKKELEELSTDEALKNASIILTKAHQQLNYLADDYAINKTAAFILKKVRETFVQQTKDKLLAGASKYFREITGGEYKAILPPEEIMEGDFQALLRDGTKQESTDLLSRGTAEQLFLAIRISRIRDIEPALPVIIDDSFVNFDNFHLVETMKLINDLARTNQIFLLTCHPHLVELCAENTPVQYWKLNNGHFDKSNKNDLLRYLRFV